VVRNRPHKTIFKGGSDEIENKTRPLLSVTKKNRISMAENKKSVLVYTDWLNLKN
jgi:hypothetical protein